LITLTKTAVHEAAFISSCLNGKSERFLLQCGYDSRLFVMPVTDAQICSFMLARPDSYFFSIYDGTSIAGSCELTLPCSGRKRVCTLMRFVIAEQYRGRGIGSSALAELSHYAFTILEADILRLFVYQFNQAAVHCYAKAGFTVKAVYSRDDGNTVLQMEKRL